VSEPAGPSFGEIEKALAAVQATLDRLTARGDDETAFELARVQFAASMRSSWPANLSTLVGALQRVAEDASLKLDEAERGELRGAIDTLGRVRHE
jgi:hypothetical protein